MNDFREYQKHPPSQGEPRRKLHPMVLFAGAAVAAAALIAGAQMLRPNNAISAWWQNAKPSATQSESTKINPVAPAPAAAETCPNCGVVVAIRETKENGGVTGGAAGGGAGASESYHVDVKLADGTTRTFDYPKPPAFATGAQVEVRGDQLVARG